MKKKIIFYFIFMLSISNIYAQHINFLGIQLGQSETIIDRLIRQRGFDYVGRAYEPANMYEGAFWMYKTVGVLARTYKGEVTEIIVTPKSSIYNKAEDFNKLINGLNKKYGKHYTKINKPYLITYIWIINGGSIEATKFHRIGNEYSDITISLRYIDKTSILYKDPKNSYKRNKSNDL